MAEQFSYQLREDLSVSQIVSFVTKLNQNHRLINKGFLKLGSYPKTNQLNFEVTYDREKQNLEGYVAPNLLIKILSELSSIIVKHVKSNKSGLPFILPTNPDSDVYQAFYLTKKYAGQNSLAENYQKYIVYAFYEVVTGSLSGKEEEKAKINTPDPISKLSYNLRAGDPIDAWIKNKGAKQFANLLLKSIPIGELLVPGSEFGPEYSGESYAFEHALEALNEFYKKFKEFITTHENYGHPNDSKEKKALNRLESKNDPYFSGRSVLELVTIDNDELTGKLSTDEPKIREYIEIIDQAIIALKKDVPPTPSGGGGDDDLDGGDSEEEDPLKKDESKIIDFDQLNYLVKNRLISYLLDEYYQELIDGVIDKDKYKVRKILLSIISDKIDAKINLRLEIRSQLETTWSDQIDGEDIYNDEKLTGLIELFIVELANALDVKNEVNQDVEAAKLRKDGVEPEEKKGEITGINASIPKHIVNALKKNGIVEEDFSEADWEKLSLSERVTRWKDLSLQERYDFLEENGFLGKDGILAKYSQAISADIVADQLAQRNLKSSEHLYIDEILQEMQLRIADDLVEIPPTEFGKDPELFIQRQRADSDFLRLENAWDVEFLPSLDREFDDYALHFPDEVITQSQVKDLDFSGITTIEEAAKLVNPSLDSNEEITQKFEYASQEIFRLIDINMGLEIDLPYDDIGQSLNDIRPYLQDFLISEYGQEGLYILYNETQLRLFISKYGDKFLDRYGRYFVPIIEERYHEAHRQQVIVEMSQMAGGGSVYAQQVDEAFHFILTEAVISQVEPEEYINSLSDEKLLGLFNAPEGFTAEQTQEFRALVREYIGAVRELYDLDELIDGSGEFDEEEFTDNISFLKQQSRRKGSPIPSGRATYSTLTTDEETSDDLVAMEEADYDELAKQGYQRKRELALAIWQAYSDEERAFLEEQEAQQMAAYEWEKLLNQQASQTGRSRSQQKKRGPIKKMVKRGIDKGIVAGTTAATGALANLIVPGAGIAVSGAIKALPIPDKYKKYLTTGILGGAIAIIGGGFYLFTHTIGGFLGGIAGGIAGFFVGGPGGIFGGALAGTYIGYGIEKAITNFFGGIGDGISGAWNSVTGAIGDGINWVGDQLGIGGGSSSGGSVVPGTSGGPGQGISAGGGSATFGTGGGSALNVFVNSTAAQTITATATTTIGGGFLISSAIHSAYLQHPPELTSYSQDSSSKYVNVEKRANPTSMENGENEDITYSVTISPQEGYVITVNQASDEISILGENSSNYNFEIDQTQISEQLQPNTQISEPITIEYILPNVSGTDIAINNTFSLDFFVEDEGVIVDDNARDSAVVTIGNPELGCFQFGESGTSIRGVTTIAWAEIERNRIINAYQRILNNTTFMGLICSDGPVTFYRLDGDTYGGWALSPSAIGIYDLGLTSQGSATYTSIHEIGHLIDYRNPGLRNNFQSVNSPRSCFTYPYDCVQGEPFAEAIALYEIHDFYMFRSGSGRALYDFPSLHPRQYQWIEDNIYGGGN
jgi:hypothetical protein